MCNARILPKSILLIPPSHLLCFVVHFDFMFALTPSLFLLLFSRSELLEQLKMRKLFNIYLHLTISSDLHFFLYITFVSGIIYLLLEKLPFVVPIAHHSLSLSSVLKVSVSGYRILGFQDSTTRLPAP